MTAFYIPTRAAKQNLKHLHVRRHKFKQFSETLLKIKGLGIQVNGKVPTFNCEYPLPPKKTKNDKTQPVGGGMGVQTSDKKLDPSNSYDS